MDLKKLYNLEYEACLLGSMILDNSCIDEVQAKIKPEYFFSEGYKAVYNSICDIYNGHHAVDLISLTGECHAVKTDVIVSLTDKVTSSSNVGFYIMELANLYSARSITQLCQDTLSRVDSKNITDVLSEIDNKVSNCLNGAANTVRTDSKDIVNQFISEIEKAKTFKDKLLGFPTGFESLDDLLDGLPPKTLVILGARPSIGKTTFAMQLMFNIAEKGVPCAVFSLEMSNISLVYRRVAAETGIKSYFIKHGMINNTLSKMGKIQSCLERIYACNINFFDTSNGSRDFNWIATTIRSLAKNGTKVFFIDHLGLISFADRTKKRYEQLGAITERLHDLALTLGITIVVLCQLRRDAEGKKPALSDLRESGDIEQNADICMFLHRTRAEGNEVSIPSELMIVKNRDGNCGSVKYDFYPALTKFSENKEKEYMETRDSLKNNGKMEVPF